MTTIQIAIVSFLSALLLGGYGGWRWADNSFEAERREYISNQLLEEQAAQARFSFQLRRSEDKTQLAVLKIKETEKQFQQRETKYETLPPSNNAVICSLSSERLQFITEAITSANTDATNPQ